jgi:hypothetical protein
VRAIVRPMILTSFVVHVLFGCCLHHTHGHEQHAPAVVAETVSDCACHQHSRPCQDSAEHQCPADDCKGDRCVFTRAETESAGQSPGEAALAAILDDGCRVDSSFDDRNRTAGPEHDFPLLAVRLHLLNQRFLL